MNLAEIDHELRKALVSGEQCIGFVIYRGEAIWLIDWVDHFTLDQQKNIDAMCTEERYRRFMPAGLTVQQWSKKLQSEFRNGIPQLTADIFPRYMDGETAKVASADLLRREFFSEDEGQYAEFSRWSRSFYSIRQCEKNWFSFGYGCFRSCRSSTLITTAKYLCIWCMVVLTKRSCLTVGGRLKAILSI
ncbi:MULTISPECIES: hypothetical protein [Rhizobium]|uniref:hypothetical protein n=1 Tax=Rhizobium TaxID=379 RepID=UPI001FD9B97B|nr:MULTISPECIES: hypothetical protein [Rhizobium]